MAPFFFLELEVIDVSHLYFLMMLFFGIVCGYVVVQGLDS